MEKRIMIVDDEKMITSTISTLIKMVFKYNVFAYNDPLEALKSQELQDNSLDLIITDFMMPGMNGLEFLKIVKLKCPETVTILLTGYADKENAIRSINEVGLYYYLEKPWDNNNLIKIVQNGLDKKNLTDTLKQKYMEIDESNRQIARFYELLKKDYEQEVDNAKTLIISLANVIEAKDKYTDGHTRRVGNISRKLGEKMGLPLSRIQNLEIAGIVHDIGKVSIPENILNKPGKLTNEEFDIVKTHPVVSETICKPLNCMQSCLDTIRHHHEKLNGKGYPDGLKGDELSLEVRIIAVADIFDALYSKRPYREKLSLYETREILLNEAAAGNIDMEVINSLFSLLDDHELDSIIDN